jgi:hypothetical protein
VARNVAIDWLAGLVFADTLHAIKKITMSPTLARVTVAALFAAGLCTLVLPFDSEARRFRLHSHTSGSSEETQQPAQPTPQQLEELAAARERAQKVKDEARERREAEYRERNALEAAKMKERRDARMAEFRAQLEAKRAGAPQKEAEVKAPAVVEAPKPVPMKMTSYKDENGVTHFTDGTDAATQARQRKR